MSSADTICALSTPLGRSAIGLIRLSGADSLACVQSLLPEDTKLAPRRSRFVVLRDSEGRILDEAVVCYFQAPNSYTGEDMVEIGAHGNPAILSAILDEIVSRGTRLAEPGEFTRRALASGKLKLEQVEALDWVLNASSREGVERGFKAKLSGIGVEVQEISNQLLHLKGSIEAQLDFSDEEVGELETQKISKELGSVEDRLRRWVELFDSYRYMLESWTVVLLGPPNSGKSSLFNSIAGISKAIVYDQPGTTRDFLEHSFEMNGQKVLLVDTAGVRESTDDPIEALGISRSMEALEKADLICWVSDEAEEPPKEVLEKHSEKAWIKIHSKADLGKEGPVEAHRVSARTGEGLAGLKERLSPPRIPEESEDQPLTSGRQRDLVDLAAQDLAEARQRLASGEYLEYSAEAVQSASEKLRDLVGEIPADEVMKNIFSRFCIGK